MKNYIPLSPKFETGIIITGLTSDSPYALKFIKGTLIDSLFLGYELNSNNIDDAIQIVEKNWSVTKRISYDSSNLINLTVTLIKKVFTLN